MFFWHIETLIIMPKFETFPMDYAFSSFFSCRNACKMAARNQFCHICSNAQLYAEHEMHNCMQILVYLHIIHFFGRKTPENGPRRSTPLRLALTGVEAGWLKLQHDRQ